ncbi:phazolicin family TOMM bacteriocin [Achromobacter spanius]|uniref:phazolicin family TOMM bacteriocin n=1 Tax=Achromobacter spanius TaxID=217203 RepID=UPI0036EB84B0
MIRILTPTQLGVDYEFVGDDESTNETAIRPTSSRCIMCGRSGGSGASSSSAHSEPVPISH